MQQSLTVNVNKLADEAFGKVAKFVQEKSLSLQALFKQLDTNNDGSLTENEFMHLFRTMQGLNLSESDYRRLWRVADKKDDDRILYSRFLELFQKKAAAAQAPGVGAAAAPATGIRPGVGTPGVGAPGVGVGAAGVGASATATAVPSATQGYPGAQPGAGTPGVGAATGVGAGAAVRPVGAPATPAAAGGIGATGGVRPIQPSASATAVGAGATGAVQPVQQQATATAAAGGIGATGGVRPIQPTASATAVGAGAAGGI